MPTLALAPPRTQESHQHRPKRPPTITVPVALQAGGLPARVRLHHNVPNLFRHIDKHLLDRKARTALRAAFPCIASVADLANEEAVFRWTRRPRVVSDDVVQAYAAMIERSLAEACELGFIRFGHHTAVTLDSAGLLVVLDHDAIATAFIPAVSDRGDSPAGDECRSRHEIARNERRRALRDGDERYYYEVFRPAVQRIRRFPVEDPIGGIEYGALKMVLPRTRDLDLVHWVAMRRTQQHGPMEFAA